MPCDVQRNVYSSGKVEGDLRDEKIEVQCSAFIHSEFISFQKERLKPATDDATLVAPDDKTKENRRNDQVRDIVAVDARNRNAARLETDRRRRRRESRTDRNEADQRHDREDIILVRDRVRAKRPRNNRKRHLRNDLVDNRLRAVTARDRRLIGAQRQDRKDELHNNEARDQQRQKRLRRDPERLQQVQSSVNL